MSGNDGSGNIAERDNWQTPQWLFDKLNEQYDFGFDCCADEGINKTLLYSSNFERMVYGDLNKYTCWMNPPFSKASEMFEHFFNVVRQGICIYRCDNLETGVWQKIILKYATWIFIPKGRISFEGKVGKGARFPSALIGFHVPVPYGLDGATLNLKTTEDKE